MQSKLLDAEKVAFLGKFTTGTAHKFITPLGGLKSNIVVTVQATQRLANLLQAVARLGDIAVSFRRFTRLGEAKRPTIDLVQGLDSATILDAPEAILVEIRDNGRGMSQEQAAPLFDVAWSEDGTRTKMRLGLSAAYATLQKHGGTMSVQSETTRGTSITFVFPLPPGEPDQPEGIFASGLRWVPPGRKWGYGRPRFLCAAQGIPPLNTRDPRLWLLD